MDIIFFWWMIWTSMMMSIGLYIDMGLAILLSIIMVPIFIHDILLKFYKKTPFNYKQKEGEYKVEE